MGADLLAIAHDGEPQRFSRRMRSHRRGYHKGAQRRAHDRAERSDGDFHADPPHQAATNQHELCNWPEIWPSFGIYPIPKASRRLPLVATGNTDLRGSISIPGTHRVPMRIGAVRRSYRWRRSSTAFASLTRAARYVDPPGREDEARALVADMEEHVRECREITEFWIEAFQMRRTDNGKV